VAGAPARKVTAEDYGSGSQHYGFKTIRLGRG
jgi:hypothetical protein